MVTDLTKKPESSVFCLQIIITLSNDTDVLSVIKLATSVKIRFNIYLDLSNCLQPSEPKQRLGFL